MKIRGADHIVYDFANLYDGVKKQAERYGDKARYIYKVNNKDSFNQTIPYLKLLIRDTLSLTVGSDKLSNSSVPEKLTRKLTREKSLSLLNTIEKAQRMMKSNVNQNLLSTWLCSEFRRITWQQ